MYTPVPIVEVRIWGKRSARSRSIPALGCYAFEYQPSFLRSGIELAPLTMPLAAASEPFVFPDLPELTYRRLPGPACRRATGRLRQRADRRVDGARRRQPVEHHLARSAGVHGPSRSGCAGVQTGARPRPSKSTTRDRAVRACRQRAGGGAGRDRYRRARRSRACADHPGRHVRRRRAGQGGHCVESDDPRDPGRTVRRAGRLRALVDQVRRRGNRRAARRQPGLRTDRVCLPR